MEFIAFAKCRQLLGITQPALLKRIASGKIAARKVPNPNGGRTGHKWEIDLSSLPAEAQQRYWQAQEAVQTVDRHRAFKALKAIEDNTAYEVAPQWQKDIIDHRLYAVIETQHMSAAERDNWLEQNGYTESRATLYRWIAAYKRGGKAALFTGYGNRRGDSCIPDDVFSIFKSVYCRQGEVSVKAAYLVALGYASEQYGDVNLPTAESFLYRLRREVSDSEIYYARYGQAAWNKKFAGYIERDYSKIMAGQVVFSDHMQLDMIVSMPDGTTCRPWLTAWSDFKSRKFLGWQLHPEAPNSDHIFQSFYTMVLDYGLPETIYIDNGKDYRSKDFAGGRRKVEVNEKYTSSLMENLGVEVRFALPYGAQTKNIERRFRDFHGYCEKLMPGYTGTNVAKRPECLNSDVKAKKIISYELASKLVDQFVTEVLNKLPFGNNAKFSKMCADEVWSNDNPTLRRASKETLKLFCTRTSSLLSVTRKGVYDPALKVTYWAEDFTTLRGRKVYLRRDLKNFANAWVFSAKDEYLCEATLVEAVHPLATDAVSKAELKKAVARKRKDQKVARKLAQDRQDLAPEVQMQYLQAGVAALNERRGWQEPQEPNVVEMQRVPLDAVASQIREATNDQPVYAPILTSVQPAKCTIFLTKTDMKLARQEDTK